MFVQTVTYFDFVFFFNDTAATEIYTLSLRDALPIFGVSAGQLLQTAGKFLTEFLLQLRIGLAMPWTRTKTRKPQTMQKFVDRRQRSENTKLLDENSFDIAAPQRANTIFRQRTDLQPRTDLLLLLRRKRATRLAAPLIFQSLPAESVLSLHPALAHPA